ncbi:MAG: ABC transporter permease [Gammaproteobacteria bacterium]|nr:ABC transporter permease [Gammaproteobacteria bacterium]
MDAMPAPSPAPFVRQVGAVFRIEVSRIMRPRHSLPAFLLAALPVGVAAAVSAHVTLDRGGAFPAVFYNLLLGVTVFFGCAFIFTKLFRAEILERTLHYYLLAPIRREALLLGKYAAGVVVSWALFGGATVVACVLLFGLPATLPWEWTASLLRDLGTTLLACVAYGAVFLLFGLLFANPILPVAGLLAWEGLHFLLPPTLQAFSVRYYLGALTSVPLPVPDGPFAILVRSPQPWVSVLTLLALTVVGLALGAWRLRRLEVRYTDD